MIKFLKYFTFIPLFNKLINEKLYACGIGTYLVNFIFKYILGINKGPYMIHFTSRINSQNKISIKQNGHKSVNLSFATSGGCYYQAINGVEIGEGTIWSYNCSFISSNFSFEDLSKHISLEKLLLENF